MKVNLKKIITISTLVCVAIGALLGILLLFNVLETSTTIGNIYLTLLTIVVVGMLLFNCLDAINSKNILGYLSGVLLLVSAILFLVLIWGGEALNTTVFLNITVWTSFSSILLSFVVSFVLIFGGKMLFLQIPFYVAVVYIEVAIGLLTHGIDGLFKVWQIFAVACIIAVSIFIALRILSATFKTNKEKLGFIKITIEEYEGLKNKIAELESEVQQLSK